MQRQYNMVNKDVEDQERIQYFIDPYGTLTAEDETRKDMRCIVDAHDFNNIGKYSVISRS